MCDPFSKADGFMVFFTYEEARELRQLLKSARSFERKLRGGLKFHEEMEKRREQEAYNWSA